MEYPRICMFDFSDEEVDLIRNVKFQVNSGTMGTIYNIQRKEQSDISYFTSDFIYPDNLQEYDVVIFNFDKYSNKVTSKGNFNTGDNSAYDMKYIVSTFPQTKMDLRTVCAGDIRRTVERVPIIIVFSSIDIGQQVRYGSFNKKQYTNEMEYCHLYDLLPQHFISTENIMGKECDFFSYETAIKTTKITGLLELLNPYKNRITYQVTFKRTVYTNKEFFPLIKNKHGDIVSFLHISNNQHIYVFPQFENNTEILKQLLCEYFPSHFPNLFPEISKYKWLNEQIYLVPEQKEVLAEKQSLQLEFCKKNEELDNKLVDLKSRNAFLFDLLTETDKKLVSAVQQYFLWLGFEDVINMDEKRTDEFEEDLQIRLPNGLVIIEVKGIIGSSKDSECSQISKIRRRRESDRKAFDVFPLYIVNHQRFVAPLDRKNPPFTPNQLKDAVNDDRGLLTTWQLFYQYKLISDGFATKEQTRKQLCTKGYVDLFPADMIFVGKVGKFYSRKGVSIVDITNTELMIGDAIYAFKDYEYKKAVISSIQYNDKDVKQISDGEIGIMFDVSIDEGYSLFKR